MKKTWVITVVFLVLCLRMAHAQDDLENIGPDSTIIATRSIDGVTVTISTLGGFQMTARTYDAGSHVAFNGGNGQTNAALNPQNVSGTRFISSVTDTSNFSHAQPVIFEFDQPVVLFGLTTIDLLEEGDVGAMLNLQAFDQAGNMIDEQTRSEPQGPSGLDLDWSVAGTGIVRVLLTGTPAVGFAGYGIDDLILNTTTTGIETPERSPDDITLFQNYPNPFNPATSIRFDLSETARVRLDIHNIKGDFVSTLVSQILHRGSHTYTWHAANMPSGVYFFKLTAGRFSKTQKMILLR